MCLNLEIRALEGNIRAHLSVGGTVQGSTHCVSLLYIHSTRVMSLSTVIQSITVHVGRNSDNTRQLGIGCAMKIYQSTTKDVQ